MIIGAHTRLFLSRYPIHAQMPYNSWGEAGDPRPYSMRLLSVYPSRVQSAVPCLYDHSGYNLLTAMPADGLFFPGRPSSYQPVVIAILDFPEVYVIPVYWPADDSWNILLHRDPFHPDLVPHSWYEYDLSLIHISEPTRRTPISYAVF